MSKIPNNTIRLALSISFALFISASKAHSKDIREFVSPCDQNEKNKPILITSEKINNIKWGSTEDSVIKVLGKPNGYLQWGQNSAFIYGSNLLLRFESKKLNGAILGTQVLDYKIANEMEQYDLWNTWNWEVKDVMSSGSSIDSLAEARKGNWSGQDYQRIYSDSNFVITPSIVSYGNSGKQQVGGIMLLKMNTNK